MSLKGWIVFRCVQEQRYQLFDRRPSGDHLTHVAVGIRGQPFVRVSAVEVSNQFCNNQPDDFFTYYSPVSFPYSRIIFIPHLGQGRSMQR